MIEQLQALRIRVRAAVEALFSTSESDRITRAQNAKWRAARAEASFLAENWRELEEHRAFISSMERLESNKNHRSFWTK